MHLFFEYLLMKKILYEKKKDSMVDVYYVFETQRVVHKPGHSRFRQQWLSDIISLKESLVKDCKF